MTTMTRVAENHLLYQGNQHHKSERAYNGTSAAYDLYANYDLHCPKTLKPTIEWELRTPEDSLSDVLSDENIISCKHRCHLIPTGIRVALKDKNYAAVIKERGSVVKGTPLLLRAGLVDYGYSGEIFVAVDCFEEVTIEPGEKLPFQLMIQYLGDAATEETTSLEEYLARAAEIDSDRNNGCIGSSDKK